MVVDDLPGWLYEGNGVLHPRGSEYSVQYVIDEIPITENHSPAYAPSFDANAVETMRVLTANYPAEYGRKLGGIVEVSRERNFPSGLHGQSEIRTSGFQTTSGSAGISYSRNGNRFAINGGGYHTGHYLDPPVLASYTNFAQEGEGGRFL